MPAQSFYYIRQHLQVWRVRTWRFLRDFLPPTLHCLSKGKDNNFGILPLFNFFITRGGYADLWGFLFVSTMVDMWQTQFWLIRLSGSVKVHRKAKKKRDSEAVMHVSACSLTLRRLLFPPFFTVLVIRCEAVTYTRCVKQ